MPGRGREPCGREGKKLALMQSLWSPLLTFAEAFRGEVALRSCPAGPEGAGGSPQLWAALKGPTAKAGVSFLPGGPAQRPPELFLALSLTIGRYAVVLYDVIIINLAI